MTDDITAMEQHLHALYAELPPPPRTASWDSVAGAAAPTKPHRAQHRAWLVRGLAGATAAALVAGGFAWAHGNNAHGPGQSAAAAGLTISLLPAGDKLSCRLPVSALDASGTTGFVVLDHGQSRFEPAQGLPSVHSGLTYVPALGRWVNILPQMVAPDGHAYVMQEIQNGYLKPVFHIIDAHSDRVILRAHEGMQLYGWSREGILIDDASRPTGEPSRTRTVGRFQPQLLDPATGAIRELAHPIPALNPPPIPAPGTPLPFPEAAPGGSPIGYHSGDDGIWSATSNGQISLISRYDIATGESRLWFDGHTDGAGFATVVGVDAQGHPIVQLSSIDLDHADPAQKAGHDIRTVQMTAPHQETTLNQGRVGDPGVADNMSPLSVTAGQGVWLATDAGAIWLLQDGKGLQQVAQITTSNKGAPGVAISGPCL